MLDAIYRITHKVSIGLPFSTPSVVKRILDREAKAVLDIGCGKGEPMRFISKGKNLFTVGVDIFPPYIAICKQNKTHNELVLCDVRFLPFKEKSFDVVLAIEVLEHLEKDEGLKLLREAERIAKKQVIITTPNKSYYVDEADPKGTDNNPHQAHKAMWELDELRREGYEVKGVFLGKPWRKTKGFRLTHYRQGFLDIACKPLRGLIWLLTAWYVYSHPESAADLIAIKTIRGEQP